MSYRDSPYLVELFDFDLLHLQLNTPLFIAVLVMVVVWLVNRWWFKPVLRSLDARQALLKEWRSAAEADNLKAEQLLSDYNKQLVEVRKSLDGVRSEGLKQAQAKAQQLMAQERQVAQRELEVSRLDLKQQIEAARKELPQHAEKLAQQVCKQLLS